MAKVTKKSSEAAITKGVLLVAFGNPGYGFASFNMLLSIKYFNPDVHVALLHDNNCVKYLPIDQLMMFDAHLPLTDDQINTNGGIDPAKLKCGIYDHCPYDETLYLDVDGIALRDISPIIEWCSAIDKPFQTSVIDSGCKDNQPSYAWAAASDIWDHFKLKPDAIYPSVQTSWMYIKKSKVCEKIFEQSVKNLESGFPLSKLLGTWGGTLPDELMVGAALAKLGIDPDPGIDPVFFGSEIDPRSFTQLAQDHYVLSLYGNGNGKRLTRQRYIEHYDRLMQKYCVKFGIGHLYKSDKIMKDKHSNKKK